MNRSATRPLRALVIGESLIDVITDGDTRTEKPGGSPMNVAIGLARQGADVAFVTDLGRDARADQIELRLVTEGVDVYSSIRIGRRSSIAHATIDADGNARYEFDISFTLEFTDTPENGLADIVHFGSLATVIEPGATHVERLVDRFRPNALVSYDPNIRPPLDPDRDAARARVDRHAGMADIVRASVSDLAHIHPELVADPAQRDDDVTDRMIAAATERWLTAGAALVAITDAERGVHLATEQHRTHLPSNKPTVVDTVGAGDAFMAGLISGIDIVGLRRQAHRDELAAIDLTTLRTVACWAQRTAEYTVGRVGAEPPTSVELLDAGRGVRVG